MSRINFSQENHPVELVQHRLMEGLAYAASLRPAARPGLCVFDLLILQEGLIRMPLWNSAVLDSSIGQDPQDYHALIIEKRQHAIVEQICRP